METVTFCAAPPLVRLMLELERDTVNPGDGGFVEEPLPPPQPAMKEDKKIPAINHEVQRI